MDAQQWLGQGICAYKSKQYEVAIGYFDQALRIDHNFADAYYWRGRVHSTLRIYAKAVADFTQAILAKPDDAESYYWRGIEQSVFGERDKAIADFDKAIELNPTLTKAYSQRAHLYAGEDDVKALRDYTKAAELGDATVTGFVEHFKEKVNKGKP